MNTDIKLKDLERKYDKDFKPGRDFLAGMPDLQNGEFIGIPIDYVGIAGMKFPLIIKQKDGGEQEVLATVIGSVDLDSQSRGINMSRILRTWAIEHDNIRKLSIDDLVGVVAEYRKKLNSLSAHITISFEYRMWKESLRSVDDLGNKNGGWIYYPVLFDVDIDHNGVVNSVMSVTYTYSSTCPCSTELTLYNAMMRGKAGAPHAQRSFAKADVKFREMVWIEDVVDAMRDGVASEVQVFVKREDEMAQSELCAAEGTVFVEDAIRKFSEELNKIPQIEDYRVVCSHAESLHFWDAIAVRTKGISSSKFSNKLTFAEWQMLCK